MSWNRKYRPHQVKDLHLTQVRSYLSKLMKASTFPQAFLFTGPKGTGKTSTSRIIGAILNDQKNEETVRDMLVNNKKPKKHLQEPDFSTEGAEKIFSGESYLVQELDAASNRRIDDIRGLKQQVNLAPVDGLVKVYILDEVHMLTTEAFNALLKMLEEPPPHVVFILATTEFEKVPETVRSRCQTLHFTKASSQELKSALEPIIKAEKIEIDNAAVELIISQADGSFRDAVKYLEMASHLDTITSRGVDQLIGGSTSQRIKPLITKILDKDEKAVVEYFIQLRDENISPEIFYQKLLGFLHHQLVSSITTSHINDFEAERLTPQAAQFLLTELTQPGVNSLSPVPFLRLELKILELIGRAKSQNGKNANSGRVKKSLSSYKADKTKKAISQTNGHASSKATDEPQEKTTINGTTAISHEALTGDGQQLCEDWPSFVKKVAQHNFSLATLLKSAQPISGGVGNLTLSVYYRFHQEQLTQPKFQDTLGQIISNSYGGPLKINCILADQPAQAELAEPQIPDQLEKLAVEALM